LQYNIKNGTLLDDASRQQRANSFKGNNSLGAKDIFEAKKQYSSQAYSITGVTSPDPELFTDAEPVELTSVYEIFNNTRLPLYGTVDRNVIPLQPKKQYLSYYLENNGGFSGLDFVINSFINMRKAYSRGMFEGKGLGNGFTLSTLEVKKARVDAQKALQGNFDLIIKNFISFCQIDVVNRKKIITPEQFVNYFSNFLIRFSKNQIVNYSSLLLTNNIDINFNGLCLDIADIQYDSDSQKVKQIILDPNFDYYYSTLQSFGFLISKEYPFKLIANLNSQQMRDNICACGGRYLNGLTLKTADEIVDFYYEPAYLYDLDTLRNLYEVAHLTFIRSFVFESVNNYYNGSIHSKKIDRFGNQLLYINELLTDDFLISLYIRIKNNEIRINFNDSSLDRFDRTSKTIYDRYGLSESLKYINEKLRLALEPFMPDKKNFVNTENFSMEEALGLIRLTRYDY
jgi:hypothetical protein